MLNFQTKEEINKRFTVYITLIKTLQIYSFKTTETNMDTCYLFGFSFMTAISNYFCSMIVKLTLWLQYMNALTANV